MSLAIHGEIYMDLGGLNGRGLGIVTQDDMEVQVTWDNSFF